MNGSNNNSNQRLTRDDKRQIILTIMSGASTHVDISTEMMLEKCLSAIKMIENNPEYSDLLRYLSTQK